MKLLICPADLDDLEEVVKRLVCACIPCAICKDPANSHLSVWIQQDIDFPLALRVVMNREKRRQLPHWARVYEPTVSKVPARITAKASVRFVWSDGPTRTTTGTALPGNTQREPPRAQEFSRMPSDTARRRGYRK